MKRLKLLIATLSIAVFGAVALVPATATYAVNPLDTVCSSSGSGDNAVCKNSDDNATTLIGTLVNVLLFLVGTLSVVMIIYGGITYTTSAGDAGKVARAKNTILYSVVGLVVSFLSYAIVNWVLGIF